MDEVWYNGLPAPLFTCLGYSMSSALAGNRLGKTSADVTFSISLAFFSSSTALVNIHLADVTNGRGGFLPVFRAARISRIGGISMPTGVPLVPSCQNPWYSPFVVL